MAYQALYRKWRPSVFEDVVGQNHIVETLKNQINSNKIAHAYLFCGSRGTGKTSTAKIFSRAINCEHPVNGNPCNECDTCKGIINNSIFDVIEIDGASNNKVDDVRAIRDEVVYPPANAKYKVYIIDEVHMLSNEAFNALLKTLEEPPSYIIFILATTEFHKIPATIISRCQKFDFKRITYNDTADRLRKVAQSDGINITESAVKLLAKAADGSLRDGLSKLDQCLALGLSKIDYKDIANIIGASDPEFLADFVDLIIDENLGEALKLLDSGVNMGMDALRLFSDVIDYFRDLMMIKSTGDFSLIINNETDVLNRYKAQCDKLTLTRLLRIIETLFEGQNTAKYSISPKLSFETALLKAASKNTNHDIEALMERIEALENKLKKISTEGVPSPVSASFFEESLAKDAKKKESVDSDFAIESKEVKDDIPETSDENIGLHEETVAEVDEDEEYDFSSAYDDMDGVDGYTIPDADFITDISPASKAEKLTEEDEGESFGDTKDLVGVLTYISKNFRDFSVNIMNKDLAFEGVMLSSAASVEDDKLIFTFDNKMQYDIAKKNEYNELIKSAIIDTYDLEAVVVLKGPGDEPEASEESDDRDPLEDLFKMAEQNQIIFKFEE
ncbi:MAG: DNA polymerase III subunit gamma/tau [Ruminococcaceae bacterium]|nr:DNA polymerase III subunit gamma/tau [Oscillospiraceae bacterium]